MRITIDRTSGIPISSSFDWCATTDNYEPGDAGFIQAYGATKEEALLNLLNEVDHEMTVKEIQQIEVILEGEPCKLQMESVQ